MAKKTAKKTAKKEHYPLEGDYGDPCPHCDGKLVSYKDGKKMPSQGEGWGQDHENADYVICSGCKRMWHWGGAPIKTLVELKDKGFKGLDEERKEWIKAGKWDR